MPESPPPESSPVEAPSTGREGRPAASIRRAVLVGGRVVAGVIATGAAVVTVAVVGLVPVPQLGAHPAGITVTPVPADQLRVCTGGVLRLGDESGADADRAVVVSDSQLTVAGSGVGREALADAGAELTAFPSAGPVVLSAPADRADSFAGATVQTPASRDATGLVASACLEPGGSAWLAGGAMTVGRTTLLVLSNPSEVTSTVTVRLWGATGETAAPGMTGITVPPLARRVVSLAGFAPELSVPVVEVAARGGRITAELQQTVVRGLDPGGTEVIVPGADPATSLVIPGVRIEDAVGVGRASALGDWEDAVAAIRLLAPGDEGGTATVRLVPDSGVGAPTPVADAPVAETSFVVELEPGRVTEVPLASGVEAEAISTLADGLYAVYVDAEVPVVGAARATTAVDTGDALQTGPAVAAPPSDFAWFPASAAFAGELTIAVAAAPAPLLAVANPTDADRTVRVTIAGTPLEVTVPAGGQASVALAAGTVTLAGAEQLVAGLSYAAPGQLAATSVVAARPLAADVVVHP